MLRFLIIVLILVLYLILGIPVLLFEAVLGRFNKEARDYQCLRLVQGAFKLMLFVAGTKITVIGEESYILAPDQLYVNYTQGSLKQTGLTLDFAILGDGFFAIQTDNGVEYTRSGSFCLNNAGQLYLEGQGLVLGSNGQPITLATDKIQVDSNGAIYTEDGAYQGQLGVYTFADNGQLEKGTSGLFLANGQQAQVQAQPQISWKYVEEANVDMLQEMSRMLTAQRALQSGAQVLKLYDGLLTKATTELGRL